MALGRIFGRARPPRPWPVRPSPVAIDRSDKPDLAGRRRFLAEHILLHTHVPKTAGSALSHGIMSIVGAVHANDLRLNRRVGVEEMNKADLDDMHFLSGHFAYGQNPDFGRMPLYLAAVREPVARAVSYYRFLLEHPDHQSHPLAKGRDFETAWEALAADKGPAFHNAQARVLTATTGRRDPDPAYLWDQLAQAYFLVIPQPGMTQAIHQLRSAFGVPWTRVTPMNVSRGYETDVAPTLRARILAANALDAELYERAAAQFDDRLKAACEYIASRCLMPLKGADT